mmetsp:Transcript_25507/g.38683  ORF Transcript_25507/g.38683 Transcript_25507/m.38683 type:complete len:310 (+) Transcript_25507:55-984(+)
MNNNNNNNDEYTLNEQKEVLVKRTEEARVFRDIMEKLMTKMQAIPPMQQQDPALLNNKDYEKERKMLLSLNALGLPEGLAVTVLTMFILRGVPRLTRRYMINRNNTRSGGYQLDRSNNSTSSNPFDTTQKKTYTVTSAMLGGLKLGLDIFVSVLMGASTSLYCLDQVAVAKQISALPLIEGKSRASEEFCEVVQKEIAKYPPEFWAQAQLSSLQYTHEFATNCYKRQAYERKLREEQGLMNGNESVAIPAGGVPDNFEGWDSYDTSRMTGYDQEGDGTLFGDFSDDSNRWAEDMVTDQENDSNRSGRFQ